MRRRRRRRAIPVGIERLRWGGKDGGNGIVTRFRESKFAKSCLVVTDADSAVHSDVTRLLSAVKPFFKTVKG
jgi:hypothetical protein